MSEYQPMIEVSVGLKTYVVPKSSEKYVRQLYYGKPEEKILVIREYPSRDDKAIRDKIIQKLK